MKQIVIDSTQSGTAWTS